MKIRLNEIPTDGRNYTFNRDTAELNPVLQDLIHNNAYSIELDIKPLNSKDFTLNGSLITETLAQCSRCAEDFNFSINKKIREILIPNQLDQDPNAKYAKSALNINADEDEISVSEYSKAQFDLGEFLHEAIAIELPFNPHCTNCVKSENDKTFIYDEKMSEQAKPNPFNALKGIKLN